MAPDLFTFSVVCDVAGTFVSLVLWFWLLRFEGLSTCFSPVVFVVVFLGACC